MTYLFFIIAVPFLAWFVLLIASSSSEKYISKISTLFSWLHFGLTLSYLALFHPTQVHHIDTRISHHLAPFLKNMVFLDDWKARVFATLASLLIWIIVHYSKTYLHREIGFSRFFRTIFLLLFASTLIAFSGSFHVFFIGWEILGVSSFLLIGFYRHRKIPLMNAFKVYLLYRIGDLGFLAALIENPVFFNTHGALLHISFIAFLCILLAASVKSAQFPFGFWLPKALEGPTPSTALFYGALSIHMGVFLLIRTASSWVHVPLYSSIVIAVGLVSYIISTMLARAQANIKGQIAYSTSAHVGIMFIEVGLGLSNLAIFHLISHALVRAYQLFTSPSVVSHFIMFPIHKRPSKWGNVLFRYPILKRLVIGEFFIEETAYYVYKQIVSKLKKTTSFLGYLAPISLGLLVLFKHDHFGYTLISAGLLILWGLSHPQNKYRFLLSAMSISTLTFGLYFKDTSSLWIASAIIPPFVLYFMSLGNFPRWIKRLLQFGSWLCFSGFPCSLLYILEEEIMHYSCQLGYMGIFVYSIIFFFSSAMMLYAYLERFYLSKVIHPVSG